MTDSPPVSSREGVDSFTLKERDDEKERGYPSFYRHETDLTGGVNRDQGLPVRPIAGPGLDIAGQAEPLQFLLLPGIPAVLIERAMASRRNGGRTAEERGRYPHGPPPESLGADDGGSRRSVSIPTG
ncbi:unnamed protein product [Calypogeia fissa]